MGEGEGEGRGAERKKASLMCPIHYTVLIQPKK